MLRSFTVQFFLLFSLITTTQGQIIWTEVKEDRTSLYAPNHTQMPSSFRLLKLNFEAMRAQLASSSHTNNCIDVPLPDGGEACFVIEPTQIASDEFLTERSDVLSFRGYLQDQPHHRIYLLLTENDFHLIGEGKEGVFFIDKVNSERGVRFINFWGKDDVISDHHCEALPYDFDAGQDGIESFVASNSWGTELRKYRMANLWTSGHVANYNNDTTAIIDRNLGIITDMNFVCERDLSITFEMAINPELLIFPDPNTDPYQGLGSTTGIINNLIGSENYEIGQAIAGGGGGVSYVGVTCGGAKAGTQSSNDHWTIVHEFGHNMGAGHMMNYCPGWGSHNMEPGAGNSIMSYGSTGVCGGGHQVPGGRINYFHSRSIDQMYNHLFVNTDCAQNIATNNSLFNVGDGNNRVDISSGTGYNDNEWHHVAVSFNRTTSMAKLYIDGSFQNEKSISTIGNINNELDVVIGADGVNGYAFDGQIEEVRIWKKALSELEIREQMHLLIRECNDGVIAYYPFDGDGTLVEDGFGGHPGTLTNGIREESSAPIGPGRANSQLEQTGMVNFIPTNITANYTEHTSASITSSWLNLSPFGTVGIEPSDVILDEQYWILGHYENTGNLDFVATFSVEENISNADAINPERFYLYHRPFNSDTNWEVHGQAISANEINNTITFSNVATYGQYLLTRGVPNFQVNSTIYNANICKPEVGNILFELEPINGYVPTNPVTISVSGEPTGTTISLSANSIDLNHPEPVTLQIQNTQAATSGAYNLIIDFTDGNISRSETITITIDDNGYEDVTGNSMTFDGNGDFVNFGAQPSLDFGGTKNFTFEAWVKPGVSNASGHIFSKYNRFYAGQYIFGLDNGYLILQREVFPYQLTGTTQLLANQWYHVAGSYDGTEMKIYVNGELDGTLVSTGGASNNNIFVTMGGGYYNNAPGYFLSSEIDELRIWNVARTEQQIRDFRHLTISSCQENLVANFQLNESGGAVMDIPAGITGDLNGDATRVIASEPIGRGYSANHLEMMGEVPFYFTDCNIDFSSTTTTQSVISKIENSPYNINSLIGLYEVWDAQYWILNRYGNDPFLGDVTIFPSEDVLPADVMFPDNFSLYGRNDNEFGDWTFITFASSADDVANSLTFDDISNYGQYLIVKSLQALPVDLLLFRGEKKGDMVVLNWSTASEEDLEGFEIQRLNEINEFEPVGWVAGKGETQEVTFYNYDDHEVDLSKTNYYRLKIKDFSGVFEYSNIIQIEPDRNKYKIDLYPNPTEDRLFIQVTTPINDQVQYQVFNTLGILEKEEVHQLDQGNNSFELQVKDYAAGIYWIKISIEKTGNFEVIPFVKK